jgi:hypothetical protein
MQINKVKHLSMSDIATMIQEVAYLALQDAAMTEYMAKEMDVHPAELQMLAAYLEYDLNPNN